MSSGNQRYINTAGSHDITMNDEYINVSTSVGAITLVFPNIRDSGAIPTNKVWFVNDVDDMAATNNVTIVASTTTPATELNGGSSVILSVSGFSAEVTPSGYYNYMVNSGTSEGGISGNGTLNYLAKFTPSGTILGNSLLYDSGVGVTIGSTSILSKFTVLTNVNDIIGLSGQMITNINAGAGAAAILFFRNNDNKGFEIGTVSSTHTTYQDIYGNASDSFFTTTVNGGNIIFRQRSVGKSIKFFNAGNGVVTGQSLLNVADNGVGFYTDTISATIHVRGYDATSANYALKVDNSASSPLFYVRNDGRISMNNLPTSNAGLSSGDLYVSSAADILANGDLVVGRKV